METKFTFRITDEGTIHVLDQAGAKVREVGVAAEQAGARGAAGFSKLQAAGLTAVVALGAVSAAAYAAKRVIDGLVSTVREVDSIVDMAHAFGLSARELSSLRLSAKEAEVSLQTIGTSTRFLSRSLVEANDSTSKQAQLFQRLGVNAKQDLLPALVDTLKALDTIPDSATRNAVAIQLLGRDSTEILKLNAAQLEQQIALNEKLGLTLGQNADAFSHTADAIDEAGLALKGLGQQITENSLPGLNALFGLITDISVGLKDIAKEGLGLGNVTGALGAFATGGGLNAMTAAYNRPPESPFQPSTARSAQTPLPVVSDLSLILSTLARPQQQQDDQLSQQLRNILSAEGGKKGGAGKDAATAAAKADADLQKNIADSLNEAEKTRLALLDAQVQAREQSIEFAQEDFRLAQQSGASQAEQLQMAQRLDDLEVLRLQATRARIQAELDGLLKFGPIATAQATELSSQLDLVDATLARGPGHMKALTAEIEKARSVTLDLGETLNRSVVRAGEGLLNSRGAFTSENLIGGTLKSVATEFIGGLLQAEAKKNEFDVKVGENFTVTLPGFMRDGAKSIGNIWSGLMDFLHISSRETASNINASFSEGVKGIAMTTQSAGNSLASSTLNAMQFGGSSNVGGFTGDTNTGGFTAGDVGGASTIAGGTSAFGGTAGGLSAFGGGVGAGSSALSAIPIIGWAYAAVQTVASVVKGLRDGFKAANKQRYDLNATTLQLGGTAFSKDPAGKIWADIFGDEVGGQINYSALTGGFGPLLDLMGVGLFQPKTRGTILARMINQMVRGAGLPTQTQFGAGGHFGLRSLGMTDSPTFADVEAFQSLGFTNVAQTTIANSRNFRFRNAILTAQQQNPGVDALRFNEALGLATVLAPSPRDAPRFANALVNNDLLLGLSPEESRRQLRVLADSQGVTLLGGLSEINKKYLQGGKQGFRDRPGTPQNEAAQQAITGIQGITKLFSDDLPAGIDVSALALANWAEKGGLNIANFQKDLEKLIHQFGSLEEAMKGGLAQGLGGFLDQFARARNLQSAGGPIDQIIKAQVRGTDALLEGLFESIRTGFGQAILAGLQDTMQESPEFKKIQEAVAAAVKGGSFDAIPGLVVDFINKSFPQIAAGAEAIATANKYFGVTPFALDQQADTINQRIKDTRFGALSPKGQEASLRKELTGITAELEQLKVGGITPEEAIRAKELATREAEIGFALSGIASSRYSPGSEAGRRAEEEGLRIAQEAADLLSDLGESQRSLLQVQQDNVSELRLNTAAIHEHTALLRGDDPSTRLTRSDSSVVIINQKQNKEEFLRDVSDAIASGRLHPDARRVLVRTAAGRA